ncbi:MAG: signal recognition particle-docking protein FtsY [Candidatus Bipolaricaulota bacterium]|nr:signal recognition particle-docking protein FtsY [Candidatus Bipolaricaulota bacterium]
MAWVDRLRDGLSRTRARLTSSIERVLEAGGRLGQTELEEIEEILIAGDVGAQAAMKLVEGLNESSPTSEEGVLAALRAGLIQRLTGCAGVLSLRDDAGPTVIHVAGVNGSGKTTTIAKLAAHLREDNPDIPITFAAADTFRAAAIEQLAAWAGRVDADLIKQRPGADPAAVVFDAIEHAQRVGGALFIDTAGRLQTDHNLMEELRKIERTVKKRLGRGSDERLLVLDATVGQNGISQARLFHAAIDLTGIVLTKLDGTAKGGVVVAVWEGLKLPVKYIGVGEREDDLHEFYPEQFVDALFST